MTPVRPFRTLCLAAGLSLAAAGSGMAQSALGLKGAVDGDADPAGLTAAAVSPPKPVTLDVVPLDVPEPLRRKKTVADPYAPQGIGNGGLRLFPALEVGAVYSSNVNESRNQPKAAAGLLLKPSLSIESDWVRHAFTAQASGDLISYFDGDYDKQAMSASAVLRLDVRRDTTATLATDYAYTDKMVNDPAEQTLYGSGAIAQQFGRATASLKAGITDKSYDDTVVLHGPDIDNSDRNYVEPSLTFRTSYDLSAMLKPYVEASYTPRFHDKKPDRYGLDRDSEGYQLTAGVTIADDPLWSGDAGLTYLHRRYHDAALNDADAVGFSGALTWSPTELTRIVMGAATSIEESSDARNPATPTYTASIAVTQSVRDNVDLLGGAAITLEDNGGKLDRTYDANLGLAWTFNPNLAWTAGYDVTWLDAAQKKDSYIEHRVTTGVTITP